MLCRSLISKRNCSKFVSTPHRFFFQMAKKHTPNVAIDRQNQYVVISPEKPSQHSASVIFMHGLGDTAMGWSDAMHEISQQMPHVKFILPTASQKPVTLNMGMKMPSWYDIKSLSSREDDCCDGIEDSRSLVSNLIQKEVDSGIPLSRIVLGGFSQGGALSLYTGYQMANPLGGVLVLSGYVPNRQNFAVNDASKNVPLLMCHGGMDQVVNFDYAKMSKSLLESNGIEKINFKVYENMQHSACIEELSTVKSWLEEILPNNI